MLPSDYYPPITLPSRPAFVPAPAVPRGETGLRSMPALVVSGTALLLSFGLSQLAHHLADPTKQVDGQLRLALFLTVIFYLALGAALTAFCLRAKVGLTWVRGSAVDAVVLGLPLGLLAGGLAVLLNTGLRGHLASDPNVEALVGGGGALRIGLTIVVTAVLAPLVEETLFRGVLAGTLLVKGPAPAVWVSAIAFAVWHMNPTALGYYVFVGLLLATLWRRRGLVASMTAHAAFNGVLTLAAVAATSGAGHFTTVGRLGFALPGGWHHDVSSTSGTRQAFDGPAGAALLVMEADPGSVSPTLGQLRSGLERGGQVSRMFDLVPGTVRDVTTPAGPAVETDVVVSGQPGHLVELVVDDSAYELMMVTSGSPAAERDWTALVAQLTLARGCASC